jgi:hypothetical protein
LSTQGAVTPGAHGTRGAPADFPTQVAAKARPKRPTAGRSPSVVPVPVRSVPVSHQVRRSVSVTLYIVFHLFPLVMAPETPGVTKEGVPGAWVRATPTRRVRSVEKHDGWVRRLLARIMHEPPAATADMTVLPGVLGSRTLRRIEKHALGPSPYGCPVARPSPRSRYGVSCIMRARVRL